MEQRTRGEFVYEALLKSFQEWAEKAIERCPEARTLQLVVDWEVGSNDFPVGVSVGRNSAESPDVLLQCLRQLTRAAEIRCRSIDAIASRAIASIRQNEKSEG